MSRPLLILRPQPGADATAARAREKGLAAIVAPLFRVEPRAWTMPAGRFDALLVTSANGARHLGDSLDRTQPAYAVGPATTAALHEQGFTNVIAGESDVVALIARARKDGIRTMLHLAGEDRTVFDPGDIRIETRIVYAAESIAPSQVFFDAVSAGAVALLHSARAARRFRELAGTGHRIAAISPAVLAAAGDGWAAAASADLPTDDALLAAAARLCQ